MEKPRAIQKIIEIAESAMRPGFYGNLQIEFKNGELSIIRKQETILPEEANRNGIREHKINYRS